MPTPRLPIVDALRGFALFGILVVNLQYFGHPLGIDPLDTATGPLDELAVWIVHALFEAKFYVLFSFLFGFGLAIQIERAAADPARLRPQYFRRLIGLLVLGIAHATLFFAGDILVTYALLGFVLWRLRNWEEWRLERFALGMLGVACVLNALIGLSISLANDAATESEFRATAAQAIAAYRGGFRDAVWQRLRDLQVIYAFTPLFTWPTAIAMFALGLVAGRSGLFRDPSRLMELARLRWRLVVTIGVLGNAAYATFGQSTEHTVLSALSFGALPIAGPMLTLMYVRWLWKFVERHPHALLTRALEAAGRLSLSNYLGQGVVCAWIFSGYGLGQFGRLGPAALVALAMAIYAAQLTLSLLWLRVFRMGPMEWLLRAFTYFRLLRLGAAH